MHARVTTYKGLLVLELLATQSIQNEVSTSLDRPGNIGQVIMNTAKHLGVSPEALTILKTLPKGQDSLGDIDWFQSDAQGECFGWLGGPYAIKDPARVETSAAWKVGEHVVIENDVPEGARTFIDAND